MKPNERRLVFDRDFLADLAWWVETDRKTALKVLELIEAVRRDPQTGHGKPVLLKHLGSGVWSRRITQEHRLTYTLKDDRICFVQARYHY